MTCPLTTYFLEAGLDTPAGIAEGGGWIGDGVWPFAAMNDITIKKGKINFRMYQLLLFAVFDAADPKEFKAGLLIKS
jgi:hypothetical protein